ncbi:MAG: thiamine-phosphate kinase [Methylobacter sp.]|nr:thiamine-phosphate kinase [Methylobacter sp.]
MPISEFALIQRFFTQQKVKNSSTRLSIGDDCALLSIPEGYELAVTTDTMVENVHFFAGVNPEQLGHKLLAVNLSDLAAIGAKPVSVTLALTLPAVNENWLTDFSKGFLALAERYSVDLIGGDTTSGPLTLTVQAMGLIPTGQALLRSTTRPGDFIYLTGCLGDAGLGLKIEQGYCCANPETALKRFNQPDPRVDAGLALRGIASACIDVSDGLTSDLGHILEQSRVGACLDWNALPLSDAVLAYIKETNDWSMPLVAGDDYELCFTVNSEKAVKLAIDCRKIGVIESEPGLRLNKSGNIQPLKVKGFEHFS